MRRGFSARLPKCLAAANVRRSKEAQLDDHNRSSLAFLKYDVGSCQSDLNVIRLQPSLPCNAMDGHRLHFALFRNSTHS
jgi:hypothetical protein